MALFTEVGGKELHIYDDSFEANEDLSSSQNVVVAFVASSSGPPKVGLPSGQGVFPSGVLLNEPLSGEIAQVRHLGVAKVKANAAFNNGIELTIAGTTGKVEAAASADFVIGIALQAATAADHLVKVLLTGTYQKN